MTDMRIDQCVSTHQKSHDVHNVKDGENPGSERSSDGTPRSLRRSDAYPKYTVPELYGLSAKDRM